MIMSTSIGKLAQALIKAQAEMPGAKKGSTNPFFKSKYADLGSVMEACLPTLNRHGLCITQLITTLDGLPAVTTVLMHESGEYISATASAAPSKNDPQGFGSVYSYLKRYGMQAIAVVPSEDDDANHASTPLVTAAKQPPAQQIYKDTPEHKKALVDAVRKLRPQASTEKMRAMHEASIGKPIDLVLMDVRATVESWGNQQ